MIIRHTLQALACVLAASAAAQDAVRGNALYRTLPGSPPVGACISCHGEPVNNRNSVLRGAAGAAVISRTITAVGAMGYLRQYLTDADLADISAYLATVVPAGAIDSLPDLSPTADLFGTQQVGTQSAERLVLLRNRQPRNEVTVGAVTSSDAQQFPVWHDCPLALPPLAQCTIRVAFRPSAVGPAAGGFSVFDSGGQLLRVGALAGVGTAAPPAALRWVEAPVLDFGQVAIGASEQRTARLTHTGTLPAQIGRLRLTGPNASRFALDADCAGAARLDPGAVCELRVRFAPQAAGLVEAWVEIESDASNAPLARASATGVAAAPSAPASVPPSMTPSVTSSAPPPTTSGGGGAVHGLWLALLAAATAALRCVRSRPDRRRSS